MNFTCKQKLAGALAVSAFAITAAAFASQTTSVAGTIAVQAAGSLSTPMPSAAVAQAVKTKSIATTATSDPASAVTQFKPAFRNGVALSNSVSGYIEDPARFVAPYILNAGVRAIRMPLRRKNLWDGAALTPTIKLNGYPTPQLDPIFKNIELGLANDVMFVLDDHTFSRYGDPDVLRFWVAFGKALQQRFGGTDLIVLELQNESGGAAWDDNYARAVKELVAGIRAAGITYQLAIGWGGWNDVKHIERAMAALDAVGGPKSIDPLNRVIWTGHHYPTTSGNDQAKAGRSKPEINGSSVSASIPAFFESCRVRSLRCMITEIGMGGGARGWLSNGSGTQAFDGRAWMQDFAAIQSRYAGTVVGTLAWGGGSAWGDSYAFKIEYAKDSWAQTQTTDYFATMKSFWQR